MKKVRQLSHNGGGQQRCGYSSHAIVLEKGTKKQKRKKKTEEET